MRARKSATCPVCSSVARRVVRSGEFALSIDEPRGPCTEPSLAADRVPCCPNIWLAAVDAGITQGVTKLA